MILQLGINYSMRDLISAVNYRSLDAFLRYGSYNANDGSAPSCMSLFHETMNSICRDLLDRNSCKICLISISFSFAGF